MNSPTDAYWNNQRLKLPACECRLDNMSVKILVCYVLFILYGLFCYYFIIYNSSIYTQEFQLQLPKSELDKASSSCLCFFK